jgi:hypothetical protein
VVVGEGAVTTDFKIKISRIAQRVFKGQADGISAEDESYMIELLTANGAALNPEDLLQALTVTMKHQIRNLREEIKVLIITNFSEPSESWGKIFCALRAAYYCTTTPLKPSHIRRPRYGELSN